MKSAVLIILVIAATALVESYPHPEYRGIPNLVPRTRYERSPDPEPQGHFDAWGQGGSVIGGYRQPIFTHDFGSLSGTAGVRFPAERFTPNVGLQGNLNLPHGTLSGNWNKDITHPSSGSTVSVGYEHEVYNNRAGSLHLTAGGQKSSGQNWVPTVGVKATF